MRQVGEGILGEEITRKYLQMDLRIFMELDRKSRLYLQEMYPIQEGIEAL
jgi:hypothetical protein